MQVIEISEPLDLQKIPNEDVVLAMGFFDGVHRGHQAVIQRAKQIATQRHLKLAIMTFDRFPKIYFRDLNSRKSTLRTLLVLTRQWPSYRRNILLITSWLICMPRSLLPALITRMANRTWQTWKLYRSLRKDDLML